MIINITIVLKIAFAFNRAVKGNQLDAPDQNFEKLYLRQ